MYRKYLFIILSLSFSTTYAQVNKRLQRGIEQAMAHEADMDSAKITGFVIGIIDHDTIWILPYGRVSKENIEPMAMLTRFEIGSVSHVFLLRQVQDLAQKGVLDLDKNINFYLNPNTQFAAGDNITLRQLMLHTSGLPKFPADFGEFETDKEQPFAQYTEGVFFEFLKNLDTTNLVKNKYLFSHVGIALLEKTVENLGTNDVQDSFFRNNRLAQGYNLAQKPVGFWQFNGVFQKTLGLKMSTRVLLNFIKKEMQLPQNTPPIVPTRLNKYTTKGAVWHLIQQTKRHQICVATGQTSGHSAFAAFVPQTQTGVVILTNSRIIQGKLGFQILRMLNNNWRRRS